MKKALSILLSLIMAFSAFSVMPFSAFALDSSGLCGNNVYWSFDSASGTLTLSGTGDTWDFTYDIYADPECNSPFSENRDIKSIIVESGVTGLGDYLFDSCINVESISLPEGLTKIGESALNFFSIIESITLPSSVRNIGAYAFSNWQKLKSITIPDGVTSIESNTFLYCYGLKYVVIPKTVTNIKDSAFYGCKDLTDVYYAGSEADRSNMTISSSGNKWLTDVAWHYNELPAELLRTGDTFEMGMYPQTKVTDDATITALGAIYCTMTNYGYMQNANADSHTFDAVDMTYADITYNGEVYRKVTINQYRPKRTDNSSSSDNSYQDDNGYTTGNTYYFKWKPIVWQVLDKESDGVYVMSKTLLDSQAYNNYYEDTTWENCSLRTWLNNDFYAAAFSENEQAKIVSITHSNENSPVNNSVSGGNDTTDNLWVLTYNEVKNDAYGFSTSVFDDDEARKAQGTDYANSQGLFAGSSDGSSNWWNRTPGYHADDAYFAHYTGAAGSSGSVHYPSIGIRPAFKVKLDSTVGKSDPKKIKTEISNYDGLKNFANAVNSGQTDLNAVLTADIVADDADWTPIGNYDNRYAGVFDGDGHTIIGLSNEDVPVKPEYAGLFGFVGENGVIQNVCTAGADMKAEQNIGAIAGWNSGGVIQYCCNTGAVSGNVVRIGGIAGHNDGVIQYCFNTGAVTNSKENGLTGGITGYNNSNGKVLNCCNTGAVTVTGENAGIGGIAGTNYYGKVKNCYNTGSISDCNYKGGIVGRKYGSAGIENCYYDKNLCGLSRAIGNEDDSATVKGLTTAQMTGENALSNMTGFDDTVWMVKADGYDDVSSKYYWYYPHLKGFDYDTTQTVADWPAKIEAAVTWNEPVSYEYTGSEIKPTVTAVTVGGKALDSSAYTVSYYKNTNDSWSTDTVNPVNAGDYKAVIKITDGGHANIEKTFTINKADLTITANQQEYTYNGAIQGPGDATYADAQEIAELITVEGLKGTDAVTSIIVDGQGKNADTYELVPQSATVNGKTEALGNYSITYVNGVLKINPKPLNITVFGQETYARYNGTEQSYTGTVLCTADPEFDYSKFSYTGNTTVKGTNAGDYELKPSVADCAYSDSNYKINWTVDSPIRLTITQCALDITADNKETNHGSDLAELTYTIDNLHSCYYNEDELNISISTNADKNKPDTYDITVSCEDNPNYAIRTFNGTYTVGNSPHTWSDVTYEWTGTSSVTASRKCVYCSETETETVNTTSEQTKAPTCTEKGETTYTATFTNSAFETQVKTVDNISTLGHKYATQGDERFTCTVCKAVDETLKAKAEKADKDAADKAAAEEKAAKEKAKAEFIAGVDGTSTESSVTVKWGRVPDAKRYVIYATYCGKKKYKKIKTVKGDITKYEIKKLYGKKLNPKKNVKVYIVAQKKVNGKYKAIFKTPTFHVAGAKSKYSNVKKITVEKTKLSLKKGKSAKIKAKTVLVDKEKKAIDHVRKLRFKSTNTSVVKVTKSGKIKAVGKGKATVFVYSNNGTAKAIKVTVK